MSVTVEPLTGAALQATLPDVARLRIEVFRAFPYLYDGDEDSERRYLEKFAAHPQSLVVAAKEGREMVGAATATPLEAEHDDFIRPFRERGYATAEIFYLAESVLLAPYRGRGIGHRFFDAREAHARRLGYTTATFCAVVRPDGHPARPEGYRPLDPFWRKRGYARVEGLTTTFAWRDLGEAGETAKPMQFWVKALEGTEEG